MAIHPTAIIDRQAEIDPSADIGPYVSIEGCVRVGPGSKVYPNVYLAGWTEIGANCRIHPGAVVGHLPQDFHFGGERSYCRVGDGTIIREFASIHRGTQPESWTIIGRECFLLGYSHVGHNCELSDGVKVYNNASLAGHVTVGENAIVSGSALVHQFVRIGPYVMVAGGARVLKDAPPYFMVLGESECVGCNTIGLRRSGRFTPEEVAEVRAAYRTLYRSGVTFGRAIETLAGQVRTAPGRAILEFVRNPSRRGIMGGPNRGTDFAEDEADSDENQP